MNHAKPLIVIVDDDKKFLETFTRYMFADKSVTAYDNPLTFLANLNNYNKNTKIILDNQFNNHDIKGINLAIKLHALGYKNLYLLSGQPVDQIDCPSFLIPILKDDLDHIQRIFGD